MAVTGCKGTHGVIPVQEGHRPRSSLDPAHSTGPLLTGRLRRYGLTCRPGRTRSQDTARQTSPILKTHPKSSHPRKRTRKRSPLPRRKTKSPPHPPATKIPRTSPPQSRPTTRNPRTIGPHSFFHILFDGTDLRHGRLSLHWWRRM